MTVNNRLRQNFYDPVRQNDGQQEKLTQNSELYGKLSSGFLEIC